MNNPIDLDALASLGVVGPSAAAAAPAAIPTNVVRIEGATPGCYALCISDDDYHGIYPGVSSTSLKQMLRSPAHYQAYLKAPDEDSDSRRFGRAVHALLLEPHLFADKFIVWKDGRRYGKKWDEFVLQHPGKSILNEAEHVRAMEAALSLRQCQDIPVLGDWLDTAGPSFAGGSLPAARTEFSIFWQETVGEGDEAVVILNKARVDLHGTAVRLALDIKTTDDVRDKPFYKQLVRLDYDLQAAHYSAGLQAFYGAPYKFGFAAVESQEPYGSRIFDLDETLFMNGVAKRRYALRRLAECQRSGVWPGYDRGVRILTLSHWDEFECEA